MSDAAHTLPRRALFAPRGPVALMPEAWGDKHDVTAPATTCAPATDVVVLTIQGPLLYHQTFAQVGSQMVDVSEFDNYDAIEARFMYACATQAKWIVLDIDSPGGLVAGCFELAQKMRDEAKRVGKTLYASISGCCGSAAYSLACAADKIIASSSSVVGSIGVIEGILDATTQDAQNGLKFALIASGARKADGNIHLALSADAIAAMQRRVNALAIVFWSQVAAARGMSVDAVAALDADTFVGAEALERGLIDTLGTLSDLLSTLHGPENLVLARQAAARHPSGYVAQSILPELEARHARRAQRAAEQTLAAAASEARAAAAHESEMARSRRSIARASREIQARALEEYRYLNPHR